MRRHTRHTQMITFCNDCLDQATVYAEFMPPTCGVCGSEDYVLVSQDDDIEAEEAEYQASLAKAEGART